jgi:VIT1/CCC1 family predicted Fe2+/Mn2+ transporter
LVLRMTIMENSKNGESNNQIVAIAAVCGGVMIPIAAVVLIFAREHALILPPIAIAIAVMGIFLGYFASKKRAD